MKHELAPGRNAPLSGNEHTLRSILGRRTCRGRENTIMIKTMFLSTQKIPFRLGSFQCLFIAVGSVWGAYPLVVDDAETVAHGEAEVVWAMEYERYGRDWALAFPVDVTFGLMPRLDAGVGVGYQFVGWAANGEDRRKDGFLDTVLSFKGRVLEQEHHQISLSLTAGVKLPTASEGKGLGSGDADAEMLLVATRSWGLTSLDANVGYTFSRPFAVRRESDLLFYGLAARHLLADSLELFGEVYAESPHEDWGATEVVVRGGFQMALTDWLLWGAALGTGLRREGPDLTATTGITWAF
jgi:hypothetical protein